MEKEIIMRKRKNVMVKKEKILMVTASALVLGLLTTTGIVMQEKTSEEDKVIIDFSELEKESNTAAIENAPNNDMDVDPAYWETNSGTVTIPGLEIEQVEEPIEDDTNDDALVEAEETDEDENEEEPIQETIGTYVQNVFESSDTLQWPIVGNVLLNYSMDRRVYFETLEQYKYNPAIIIQATEGDIITSASSGVVNDIFYDEEIGNGIEVAIDDQYTIIYGQLTDLAVKEGNLVEKGTLLGVVATPTKYYIEEGSNVYFQLIKNGEAIDPMSRLE